MSQISGIRVTLKAAVSLDGKIATASGNSKWITGETARRRAHQLRVENDAILVGINTVLIDDPRLTVRGFKEGTSPLRIVLDSKARIPEKSQVFKNDGVPVIIVTGNNAPPRKWPKLSNLTVIRAPTSKPEILWLLSELKKFGIKNLLVEGGSLVNASFLKSKCVSGLELFLAPKIIGGQKSISWCGDLNIDSIEETSKLSITAVTSLGEDWLISAKTK